MAGGPPGTASPGPRASLRSVGSPALGLLLIGFAYVCVEAVCATVYVAVGSRLGTTGVAAA